MSEARIRKTIHIDMDAFYASVEPWNEGRLVELDLGERAA
jgi:nucleotidyltransferase/DNA polymerase involved in DNA repair